MGRGGHLGGAGDEPKLLVESVALGAAGIGVGGERGGGRSSGSSGARPQRTGGMVKGLAELLRMLGARCRARTRPKQAMAATAAWPAAASSGRRQSGSCGVQTRERRGGNSTGAHSGCSGGLGELGEAPEPTNLMKTAGGSEVEDDVDGGDAARPGPRGSLGR